MEVIVSVCTLMKTKYNYTKYVHIFTFLRSKYSTEDLLIQCAFFVFYQAKRKKGFAKK